jgi:Bacterial membrane protein YfhO
MVNITTTLENLPPGRVYTGMPADFGKAAYYRIGLVPLYAVLPQQGIDSFGYAYSGLDLVTDVRLLFNNTKPEQYNLFNIRYVILHRTWTAPSYYSRVKEFDDYILYQVPTTGYFDLVDAPAVFFGNTSTFYYPNSLWLNSPLPQLKEHPVIQLGDTPVNTSGLPVFAFSEVDERILASLTRPEPAAGEMYEENVSMNEYRARFMASRDSYLMLKTNYHPGWVATLDGTRVPTVMLAPGFIGIPVHPGTHEVVFSYQPPFYRLPLWILGFLILVLLGLYQWKISQKKEHPPG